MIEYPVESTLCAAVLYMVFLIFFKRSRNYHANRAVLLGSVLFFTLAPFVQFSMSTPLSQEIIEFGAVGTAFSGLTNVSAQAVSAAENLDSAWSFSSLFPVYILISVLLLGRLALNLYSILSGKFVSERTNYNGQSIALVNIEVSPFSFFKTIYLNKERFQNGEIDDELILHESAHIRQLHTLDILFIELAQVICWFNPFVFLFKKLIKINHEYLADEFVIDSGSDRTEYSNKLINYTTRDKTLALTSGFNYALIKNRLIMLSKYDQKSRIVDRLAILAVIIAGLFFTTAFTNPDPIITLNENSGYFYADTIYWSGENQKVYVRGDVEIKVGENDVRGTGSFSFLGEVKLLIVNGAPAKMDQPILVTGKKCEVLILSELRAEKEYGEDGKHGAVIIKTIE